MSPDRQSELAPSPAPTAPRFPEAIVAVAANALRVRAARMTTPESAECMRALAAALAPTFCPAPRGGAHG